MSSIAITKTENDRQEREALGAYVMQALGDRSSLSLVSADGKGSFEVHRRSDELVELLLSFEGCRYDARVRLDKTAQKWVFDAGLGLKDNLSPLRAFFAFALAFAASPQRESFQDISLPGRVNETVSKGEK